MIISLRSFLFVAVTTGFSSILSVIGGTGLEAVSDKVLPLVPLLIALPALNTLVGDYSSIIAAHTGDKSERKRTHREVFRAIFKVIAINIAAICLLSIALAVKRGYLDPVFFVKFTLFVSISVVIIVIFMFGINKSLDRLLLKKGFYPDDLLIPVSTGLADLTMLTFVTLAVLFIF